jgi:hypothetical protein
MRLKGDAVSLMSGDEGEGLCGVSFRLVEAKMIDVGA